MSAVVDLPEEQPPARVRLRFLQSGEDRAVKEARVLAGTTIFDAASWNGIAIDSTCGGHGPCKKGKVKVLAGSAPLSPVDPRAFSTDELRNGWRLACRAAAQEDLTIEVPPPQTGPKGGAPLAGPPRRRTSPRGPPRCSRGGSPPSPASAATSSSAPRCRSATSSSPS